MTVEMVLRQKGCYRVKLGAFTIDIRATAQDHKDGDEACGRKWSCACAACRTVRRCECRRCKKMCQKNSTAKCPTCKGTGTIEEQRDYAFETISCPHCDGTGDQKKPKEKA